MRRLRSEKGAALIIMLLVIMSVTSILIGSGLVIIPEHFKMVSATGNSLKALYIGNAGIGRAVYKVRTELVPSSPETFTFEGTDVTLTIAQQGTTSIFNTTATCNVGGRPMRITAKINRITPPPNGKVEIREWKQE